MSSGRIVHSITSLVAISEVEAEAIEPTELDKQEVGRDLISVTSLDKGRQKFKKKRRVSPRAKVVVDLKAIDHSVCGPPCR